MFSEIIKLNILLISRVDMAQLLRPYLCKMSSEAAVLQTLRSNPSTFLTSSQNIKTFICCSLTKKPKSIFTQADLDKVNRKQVKDFEDKIQEKASGDMFGSVKYLGKALLISFIGATITQIAYGK